MKIVILGLVLIIKLWLFAKINTFLSSFFKYLQAIFQKNKYEVFLTYPNKKYITTVTVKVKLKIFPQNWLYWEGFRWFLHWTVHVIPVKKYFKNQRFFNWCFFATYCTCVRAYTSCSACVIYADACLVLPASCWLKSNQGWCFPGTQ